MMLEGTHRRGCAPARHAPRAAAPGPGGRAPAQPARRGRAGGQGRAVTPASEEPEVAVLSNKDSRTLAEIERHLTGRVGRRHPWRRGRSRPRAAPRARPVGGRAPRRGTARCTRGSGARTPAAPSGSGAAR
jgi:hypothetical protein